MTEELKACVTDAMIEAGLRVARHAHSVCIPETIAAIYSAMHSVDAHVIVETAARWGYQSCHDGQSPAWDELDGETRQSWLDSAAAAMHSARPVTDSRDAELVARARKAVAAARAGYSELTDGNDIDLLETLADRIAYHKPRGMRSERT
jgi:hypothetical protein